MTDDRRDLILMVLILAALAAIIWVEHPSLRRYLRDGGETRSVRVGEMMTCRSVEECWTPIVAARPDDRDDRDADLTPSGAAPRISIGG